MAIDHDVERFRRKFKTVHYEIDYLKAKINQKSGFWIFKSHVYTIDELLASEHHAKIYAITEKIGDDAKNWHKAGELSGVARDAYYNERETVEDRLHQVNLEIQTRQPTWWEETKDAFTQFVRKVINNMPDLGWRLLDKLINKLLPSPIKKLLSSPSASTKPNF